LQFLPLNYSFLIGTFFELRDNVPHKRGDEPLVYHRYKARSGYDTRAGILRVCAWMYLFKNYGVKDWVAFAEVFGMPLRLGKYDSGASKADKDALVAAIRSLGSDAAGIISKNTEIEFVEAIKNAGTNNIYESLANFCDAQMSKAILGQTATTEGTPGKLGNEDAQDRVRHDLIKADSESLGKTVRFQIIRPLVGYNFGWDTPLPWFNLLYERPEDLEKLINVYKGASEIGQPISAEHVSERFKIPMPKKGETILAAPATFPVSYPVPPGFAAGNAPLAARYRVKSGDNHGMGVMENALKASEIDAADIIAEKLGQQALPPGDALIAPLKRLIEKAETLEELRDSIIDLYGDMDPADLGAVISRAMTLADASGRYEVRNGY